MTGGVAYIVMMRDTLVQCRGLLPFTQAPHQSVLAASSIDWLRSFMSKGHDVCVLTCISFAGQDMSRNVKTCTAACRSGTLCPRKPV
jgi:hypothetical protein